VAQVSQKNQDIMQQMTADVAPEASPLLQMLTQNARAIIAVAGLCAVLGIGYGAYAWYSEKTFAEAQAELGRISLIAAAPERIAALTAFIAKAPEKARIPAYLELAKAGREAGDEEQLVLAWDGVAQDAGGALYPIACIAKAEALSALGRDAEALAFMEKVASTSTGAVRAQMEAMIVMLAEKTGKLDQAITVAGSLADNSQIGESEFWRQKAASLARAKAAAAAAQP